MHALALRNISKSYPGVQALDGVDFAVECGEVHALVGKNGAGKSTLIKVVGGIIAPDGGSIEIDGRQTQISSPNMARRLGIGVVHQELSLIPSLSVAENIFLGRLSESGSPRVRWGRLWDRAAEILQRLDSDISPRLVVSALSVGQQQLVEIAKALSLDPRILILDEPTSALSAADAQRLIAIVQRLAADGTGVVYISHRLAEIDQVADRVTVLRDGATVASRDINAIEKSDIVAMMLGDELIHAEEFTPPASVREEVVLSVTDLHVQGATDGIDLDLHAGEILGIAGLVGAGRSELVRAIFGADPIDSGLIRVAGRSVGRPTPAVMKSLGVGLVPEDRKRQGLVMDLPIRDNIALTVLRRLSGSIFLNRRREASQVADLIERLEIKASGPMVQTGKLSGGNQQKVVIAKWLATEPRVLILDEPTRGIDVQAKAQIFRILERLAEQGVGIIIISSELEEVFLVSHRIIALANGRIVYDAPRDQANLHDAVLQAASG